MALKVPVCAAAACMLDRHFCTIWQVGLESTIEAVRGRVCATTQRALLVSDTLSIMSDMSMITMRTLSRETARVLDELTGTPQGVVVTRDGIPVARVVPISAPEREMVVALEAQGLDPWNPPPLDPTWHTAPAAKPGEMTASDYLQEERDSYYDEP